MSFQNSDKIYELWKQYNVSGSIIGKKEDAELLNDETIDLHSKKIDTDSNEIEFIDIFSFDHVIFPNIPVINNKFSFLSDTLNLSHSLFLYTGDDFQPNQDQLFEWENETQSVFGFPLYTIPLKHGFNIYGEINKILRFSAPSLSSEWLYNNFENTWPADTFEKTIRNHFGIREIKQPVLFFQYSKDLFLRYCFTEELNSDSFIKALHDSKILIDRFFSTAID